MDVLKRFGMMDCKSMSTPMVSNIKKLHDSDSGSDSVDPTMYRQIIGSLLYLVHTRPDICFTVSALSQFMVDPRQRHWVAAKHVLRYLRGTIAYGLRYTSSGGVMLHGFTDSDWAEVLWTEKTLLVTASVWVQPRYPGQAGNKSL